MSNEVLFKQGFKAKIKDELSGYGFTSDDFDFVEDKNGSLIRLKILYLYDDKYKFYLGIKNNNLVFSIFFSPGNFLTEETLSDLDETEVMEAIRQWLLNIKNDIHSTAIGKQVLKNEEAIKKMREFVKEKFDETEQFTSQEISEMKEKLDFFEQTFTETIKQIETDKIKSKAEQNKLKTEIQFLREQVEILTKQKWASAFFARFIGWTSRNPEVTKQLGSATAKALLPQEIHESIDLLLPPGPPEEK